MKTAAACSPGRPATGMQPDALHDASKQARLRKLCPSKLPAYKWPCTAVGDTTTPPPHRHSHADALCECSEIILPRNWLNSLVPMALRVTTTSGAKGPPSPLFPATTVKLRRPAPAAAANRGEADQQSRGADGVGDVVHACARAGGLRVGSGVIGGRRALGPCTATCRPHPGLPITL